MQNIWMGTGLGVDLNEYGRVGAGHMEGVGLEIDLKEFDRVLLSKDHMKRVGCEVELKEFVKVIIAEPIERVGSEVGLKKLE